MWFALVLRLWLGPDAMSIQPSIPGPNERTIHDVEVDLTAARYAQKRGPQRRYPDEVTRFDVAVNAYLDEWVWMRAGLDALDFPVDVPAIQAHGNLDAGCA